MHTQPTRETLAKTHLIKRRREMLAVATAILVIIAVAHAAAAGIPAYQVALNLAGGLATTWALTLLIFNIVFRLSEQVEGRDRELALREGELGALQRISAQISATLDLQGILDTISQEAMAVTAANAAYVLLCREAGQEAAVVAPKGEAVGQEAALPIVALAPGGLGEVLKSGQPLLIRDSEKPPQSVPLGTTTRSALAVPIMYEGAIAGSINVHSDKPDAFAQRDADFLSALARQASIAIGNARRYEDQVRLNEALRHRAEQQQSLFEASCSLRMDHPLDVILEDIAYAIQESVGFNMVLISMVEGDPPYLRRMAGVGIPLEALAKLKERRQPLPAVRELFQDRFLLGQSYFIPHREKAIWQGIDVLTLLPDHQQAQGDAWHAEDMLFTPLRSADGKLIGVISVDDPRHGRLPTPSDVEVLETFAVQAALAIENAQLYGALQQRIVELNALNDIGRALGSTLEEDRLLSLLGQNASELVQARRFGIALYDEASGEISLPFVTTCGERVALDASPADQQRLAQVIQSGEPLVVAGTGEEGADPEAPSQGGWLGVPMRAANKVMGAIIAEGMGGRSHNGAQLSLLTTIAAQAATALQNARLYDQIRQFNAALEQRVQARTEELAQANTELTTEKERAEALYRITRELGASLDLGRVLVRALTLVSQAVNAKRGAIALLDRQTNALHYRTLTGRPHPLTTAEASLVIPPDQGVIGWVMRHRQPLVLPDAAQDPRWVEAPAQILGEVRSLLATPLMLGDEVLGIMLLADAPKALLNPEQLRLVSAAASQVAQAISNAELYNLILQQARRLGDTLRSQQTEASEKAAILDGITDGVLVVNPRSEIILLNHAGEEILDIQGAHLIGRSIHDLGVWDASGEDRAVTGLSLVQGWLSQPWERFLGRVLEEQFEAAGRVINVRLSSVQMRGEILGAVAVFRDITREVQADRAKSEFISTVSHELRTPMTSIKGYTDLLLMSAVGELNESQRRFLGTIKSNVDRLADLVGDLLDISRIESGRVKLEIQELQLDDILIQVMSAMRGQFAAQRVLLVSELPDDLPTVRGDQKRLTQVVSNLLRNACQYTLPGGQATVQAHVVGDQIQVDIVDTGIGISEENQQRLFERFFRAEDHPVVMETPGTGLGLAIVKSIIEMHNGRVWIASALGQGTTASFALPIAQSASAPVPSDAPGATVAEHT